MSMTPEQVSEYVFSAEKELRLLSLDYIVSNIEPYGNIRTLRALQACFIAGYKEGHSTGFESATKIHDALVEHMEREVFPVVQHEPLLKEKKDE
jgi:hypothetical protein